MLCEEKRELQSRQVTPRESSNFIRYLRTVQYSTIDKTATGTENNQLQYRNFFISTAQRTAQRSTGSGSEVRSSANHPHPTMSCTYGTTRLLWIERSTTKPCWRFETIVLFSGQEFSWWGVLGRSDRKCRHHRRLYLSMRVVLILMEFVKHTKDSNLRSLALALWTRKWPKRQLRNTTKTKRKFKRLAQSWNLTRVHRKQHAVAVPFCKHAFLFSAKARKYLYCIGCEK